MLLGRQEALKGRAGPGSPGTGTDQKGCLQQAQEAFLGGALSISESAREEEITTFIPKHSKIPLHSEQEEEKLPSHPSGRRVMGDIHKEIHGAGPRSNHSGTNLDFYTQGFQV